MEPIEKKLADPFLKLVFPPASVAVKAARRHPNKLETHPANVFFDESTKASHVTTKVSSFPRLLLFNKLFTLNAHKRACWAKW